MSLRKLWFFLTAVSIAAFAIVGALKVPIKEYDVPTPHARPHDPALAPDRALWVTEQMANKLGRLDPNTASAGLGVIGFVSVSEGPIAKKTCTRWPAA